VERLLVGLFITQWESAQYHIESRFAMFVIGCRSSVASGIYCLRSRDCRDYSKSNNSPAVALTIYLAKFSLCQYSLDDPVGPPSMLKYCKGNEYKT